MGGVSFPQHYKIFYALYDLTYLGIGVVMLAFGVETLLNFLSVDTFTEQTIIAASAIFIGVGGMKILLSILGSTFFFLRWKPLYAIYVILSVFLMLATFAAAIVAFLTRPSAHNTLVERLGTVFNESITNNDTQVFNDLQLNLGCCGPTRLFNNTIGNCNSTLPADTVFGQGCLQPLSDQLLDRLYNLGAIGMAFGSYELTTFLVAIQHTEGSGL